MYTVTFSAGAIFTLGVLVGIIITVATMIALALAMSHKKK